MANNDDTLTNTMTNAYVVIFLSVSIFGRGYHSRYQNFEFTGIILLDDTDADIKDDEEPPAVQQSSAAFNTQEVNSS